jgi:hypothetical protein
MTPTEEAQFIQLWEQGASYKAIAQAMRCPLGTVASRSAALAAQGKIQPRPRGGAYSSRRAKAWPESSPAPVQRPVQSHDTGAVHVSTPVQCRLMTLDQRSASIGWKTRCRACAAWSSPWSIASITNQCRHRCRSLHCLPTRRVKR